MASGNGISGLINFNIFWGSMTPLDTGVSSAPLACTQISSYGYALPCAQTLHTILHAMLERVSALRVSTVSALPHALAFQCPGSNYITVQQYQAACLPVRIFVSFLQSFQQELDSLTTEKKALESIRSENSRNRQIFQARYVYKAWHILKELHGFCFKSTSTYCSFGAHHVGMILNE